MRKFSLAHAEQSKVLVGFKYYNTSTWGMTTKSVYKDVIGNNIIPILAKNNYDIVNDEKYFDKLKTNGYSDFSTSKSLPSGHWMISGLGTVLGVFGCDRYIGSHLTTSVR